jgi:AcrR family transcriptional regulator
MADTGYASVTYRAVAAQAKVTPGLVQYYFPTLDDLFVAAIRRRSEQNVERLAEALRTNADEPLRVLWEYSRDESTSALTTEFLALGNHRKSIKSEIRPPSRSGVSSSTRSTRRSGRRTRRWGRCHAACCCSC